MPTTTSSKKRFLLVVIILLIGAGVLAIWLPYHWEQSAITDIEAYGGNVKTESGGPDWLREWVGDEYMKCFDRADQISLDGKPFDGNFLKHVGRLKNIRSLFLNHTQVTDAELRHLSDLTNLVTLSLNHTQVTDAGLKHLSGLTNLESLSLIDTHVTEKGIQKLRKALPDCSIDRTQRVP